MTLDERILAWLAAHPGDPQSVAQLAAAIPEGSVSTIRNACENLRARRMLGRKGAGEPGRPFRFYLKETLTRRVAERSGGSADG